jgi:type II secretory pathway predicted ATPase ExeA
MAHDQLEAVRMLTNSDLDSGSPLTILLIGQPTLRRRLRVGHMAALDQRIQLRYRIPAPPLTRTEAGGYIRAHLSQAGRSDTLFSDNAVRVIHGHARGPPRAINRLAIGALLAACITSKTIVDESSARTAISEQAAATD